MNGETQNTESKTRFDLEQEIMECWKVVNDIELFDQQGGDMKTLSAYYEQKFQRLWDTFESLTHQGKIS